MAAWRGSSPEAAPGMPLLQWGLKRAPRQALAGGGAVAEELVCCAHLSFGKGKVWQESGSAEGQFGGGRNRQDCQWRRGRALVCEHVEVGSR